MSKLPGGLGEAQHLLGPWPLGSLLSLLVLAVLAAWFLWRARRRPREVVVVRGARQALEPEGKGLAREIHQIRQAALASRLYREGCHRLSALLRHHFEEKEALPFQTLTTREILRRVGQTPAASILELLEELQFRRREPERDELKSICDLAITVVGGERGAKELVDG